MVGYQVVTSAVRAEAGKWDRLSAEIGAARQTVTELTLTPLAFFVFDPTRLVFFPLRLPRPPEELQRVYEEMRAFLESRLKEGEAEFTEIGNTLIKIAETYERNEQVVEFELGQIY